MAYPLKTLGLLLPLFLSGHMSAQGNVESHHGLTALEIISLVTDTDEEICGLDIAHLHQGRVLEETPIGEFLSQTDETAGYGIPLKRVYRQAALNRRLWASVRGDVPDETVVQLARVFYADLDGGVSNPSDLSSHLTNVAYWDERLDDLQAAVETPDAETAAYQIQFCIVNERGGAARAAARDFVIDNIGSEITLDDPDLFNFVAGQQFHAAPFKRAVFGKLGPAETFSGSELVQYALLRDRATALLPTDPKTADAFWIARQREIEAVLNHLQRTTFETPAEELIAMTRLDQSLRNLLSILRLQANHFGSPEEARKASDRLWEYVAQVDEFNTARVTQILEGRNWFQDDLDGEGAGFAGWLLVQHADLDPEFQKRVLSMMELKLDAPGVSAANYGYLYDRVAVAEGRPQRFGTQAIDCQDGKAHPGSLEDAENIDTMRALIDLGPLDEYMNIFGYCTP